MSLNSQQSSDQSAASQPPPGARKDQPAGGPRRRNPGGITHQVNRALKRIFTPGQSRHADKRVSFPDGSSLADRRIYSIRTMRSYVRSCVRACKWIRDKYGVRDIRNIKSGMVRDYLDHRARQGRAGGTIGRDAAALGKLDRALHNDKRRWDTGGNYHSDRRPERVYSSKDADRIEASMRSSARDKQTADVVKVQRVTGARVSEAVRLRGKDIDLKKNTVRFEKATKGGRARVVKFDAKDTPFMEKLKERAERNRDGHVFQNRASLVKRVQGSVSEACKRLGISLAGTHGFRKLFARERYRHYRKQGMSDAEARQSLSRDLGHNRVDDMASYLPDGFE
jgi:integrase